MMNPVALIFVSLLVTLQQNSARLFRCLVSTLPEVPYYVGAQEHCVWRKDGLVNLQRAAQGPHLPKDASATIHATLHS